MRNTRPGPDLQYPRINLDSTILVRLPDHGGDGEVVDGGHVAEDGEHEHPGGEAGAGVDHTGDQRVTVAVVVKLVIRAKSGESPRAHTMEIKKCNS